MNGDECDADAVLAASLFLSASGTGQQVQPEDLHITDESLPACEDDHLPDNAPTTAQEAEAAPEPPDSTECDASRGGTLSLCKGPPPPGRGMGTNCVMIGEYTGPPTASDSARPAGRR